MSFIFAGKKPSEFDGYPTAGSQQSIRGIDGESYTCYRMPTNTTYKKLLKSGVKEIWWDMWVHATSPTYSDSFRFFIRSASTNVHLYNANVTINGTSAGSLSKNYWGSVNIIYPMQFHVKSSAVDGLVEILISGESVFSTAGLDVLNGEDITQIEFYCSTGTTMDIRDAIVATHEIPCGLLLQAVAADISALNGWTQSGTELSTETAGATFTMKPNAAAIATLSATKSIDGILPSFAGAASTNVSSLDVNSDDSILLSSVETDYVGKVRTLVEANAGLTVEAVA